MSPSDLPPIHLRDEHGVTLIELLVAMIMALVVSLAAFAILQFTTDDVSRITSRTHVDQTGRVALQKIMLQLHSACVSVNVNPIQTKSSETRLKFVSETSSLNSSGEPTSSFSTVKLHELIYTPPSGKVAGTLTEKAWKSTGTNTSTGEYLFNNETESPAETKLLLTGIVQSEKGTEKGTEKVPLFQYYRYYNSNDTKIKNGEAKLGEIDPEAMSAVAMAKEEIKEKTRITEAEKVAKVAVSFTLMPEGHESVIAKGYQPVALEDSAILRFTPASEEAGNTNQPCAEI
jgi:prepilin-type N-terminal cleavage/methylation domain-containing protein